MAVGKSFSTSAQDATPEGIWFRDNGLQMFMVGDGGNGIYRYTLSDAYDISTASYDTGQFFSVASQTGNPTTFFFKPDGLKFYVVERLGGTSSKGAVFQYKCNSAWDLTTASYDSLSFDLTESSSVRGMWIKSDGAQMFVCMEAAETVYRYSLATAWNISTASFDTGQSFSVTTETANPRDICFANSGAHMFVCDYTEIARYDLGTPWDLTTASFTAGQDNNWPKESGNTAAFFVKEDGTKVWSLADIGSNYVYQYDMTTAYDVNTLEYTALDVVGSTLSIAPTLTTAVTIDHIYTDTALTITPTLTTAATIDHLYLDGAVSLTPTISSTMTNDTVYVDGAVSITPTIATVAELVHAMTGAVTITPTITAVVEKLPALIAAFDLPVLTTTGYVETNLSVIPALTATGVIEQSPITTVTLPALTAAATGISGNAITGTATLPSMTSDGWGPVDGDVALPALTADGAVMSSSVLTGTMTLPALIATSGVGDDRFLDDNGYLSLPALTTSAVVISGTINTGAPSLPMLVGYGQEVNGTVTTGAATLPALEADTLLNMLIIENLISGNLVLPALEVVSYLESIATLTFTGWVTNTENLLTSEYTNYNYLALADIFGKNIGVSSDGIYELTGSTDNTTNIDADVLFGFDSFRTEDLKRVKTIHMGYRADNSGDLVVQITIDGEDQIREYAVQNISSASGLKRGRAKIAKGLKSRYWQYGFKNVAGADFTVDDLSIFVEQHNRKAQ